MVLKQILTRVVFILLAVAGGVLFSCKCIAQVSSDSTRWGGFATHPAVVRQGGTDADTLSEPEMKHKPFQPNPKKAGLYSALVPGMGQLYNRQYWKMPVVYVGFGVIGYFFVDNLNNYQSYRKAYIGRINNPYPTDQYVGKYSTDQLQQLQNDYNKFLDMSALCGVIGYALEVLDAVTSAHLKNFDISRDISMKIRPVATPNGIGMGLVMNIK